MDKVLQPSAPFVQTPQRSCICTTECMTSVYEVTIYFANIKTSLYLILLNMYILLLFKRTGIIPRSANFSLALRAAAEPVLMLD